MCFDISAAMQHHRPVGAPPPGAKQWQPVSLRPALVFTGGYQNKEYSIATETVNTGTGEQQFVHVKKSDPWLLHACRGSGYRRGDLKRSKILDTLLEKALMKMEESAVAEQLDDPMMQVECDALDARPTKKNKSSPSKKRQKGEQVVSVEADLVPKAADPLNTDIKQVRLLVDHIQNGIYKLFIHADDLPWLVAYIADEVGFGGVIQEPEEASAVARPNSSVPDLRVEWDFRANVWKGEFLAGPLESRCWTCGPENFTTQKWNRVVQAGKAQGSLQEATGEQVEQACLKFLELHCQKELSDARKGSRSVGETEQ